MMGARHWIAIALALVPVPFVINDAIHLRLWETWWGIPFALIYTLIICALIYGAVSGVFWLVDKLRS